MMYKIKYNSYFDLPLDRYFSLLDNMKKTETEYDKSICIAAAFTDCTENEIEMLQIDEFSKLWEQIPSPKKSHTPLPLTKWNGKPKATLDINGRKLSLSPDLTKFSLAQYIDFQMSLREVETKPEVTLSTIMLPYEAKTYNDGYDTTEHISWIRKNISIGLSNQIIDFFLKRYLHSINRTAFFSEARMRAVKMTSKGDTKRMAEQAINANRELRRLTKSMLTTV